MRKIFSAFLSVMLCVSIGNPFMIGKFIDKTPMPLPVKESNEETNEDISEEKILERLSDHGGLGGGEDNI